MPIREFAGRAARSVSWRAASTRRSFARRRARASIDAELAALPRATRDRCWCSGDLVPFAKHPSYGVCVACGAYVNRRPPTPEALRRLYTLDLYWRDKQVADGMPRIDDRSAHDRADGRVGLLLELVRMHAGPPGVAVEIGCAHGVLLQELAVLGWSCVGVEVDPDVARWTAARTGLDIRSGVFPDVSGLSEAGLFLAIDVLEHVPDPEAFLAAAAALLRPGGTAILQMPIDRGSDPVPFGDRFADAFDDLEHLFVFTDRSIAELAGRTGLELVELRDGLWPIGEIVVLRKPS